MIGPWLTPDLPVFLPDPIAKGHPLNQGRFAWYLSLPGGDGLLRWPDLVGNYPVTLAGMAAGSGWGINRSRKGGYNSVVFGSSDTAGTVSGNSIVQDTSITVGAWVYPTTSSGTHVISSWILDGAHVFYDFYVSAGILGWFDGANARSSGISVPANTWSYVAGSRPIGSAVTLTFVVVTSPTVTTATAAVNGGVTVAAPLRIGYDTTAGQNWAGALDDVSLWVRNLSVAEIVDYADLSGRGYPGMLNRVMPFGTGTPRFSSRRTISDRTGSRGRM